MRHKTSIQRYRGAGARALEQAHRSNSMTTITKERLQEIADHPKNALNATMQEVVQMARMLLASMDSAQEPVAWLWTKPSTGEEEVSLIVPSDDEDGEDAAICGWVHQPLFTGPQPPDDEERAKLQEYRKAQSVAPEAITFESKGFEALTQYDFGWNACRAAMLRSGDSPVIPDGWVDCTDRLPEETNDADGGATGYLVLYADGKEPNAGFKVGVWNVVYLRRWWCGFITHWMPLPAAPQQE